MGGGGVGRDEEAGGASSTLGGPPRIDGGEEPGCDNAPDKKDTRIFRGMKSDRLSGGAASK